jgi:hypothetical protein
LAQNWCRNIKLVFVGLSAMIQGAEDGKNFVVKHYEEAEADEIFRNFFQNLKSTND